MIEQRGILDQLFLEKTNRNPTFSDCGGKKYPMNPIQRYSGFRVQVNFFSESTLQQNKNRSRDFSLSANIEAAESRR